MTVGVATVLSARDWEPQLVAHARSTATIRIVVRAFQPSDLDRHLDDVDVVVAGGEVSWVTPAVIASWRSAGVGVLGVAPTGDEPAAGLLTLGGADEVVPDSIDVAALVQAIRFVAPRRPRPMPERRGSVVAVVGSRGAPGCTEVAISYALACTDDRDTLLVDADVDAPAVAVRLGLPPRPDLADIAEAIRIEGHPEPGQVGRFGDLDVIVGSHRPYDAPLGRQDIAGVIRAAAGSWDVVVVDVGASSGGFDIVADADEAILVVDACALGIVRAARLVEGWMGPAPALVLNRVAPAERSRTIEAVRAWTGLDPAVVVPDRRQVRRAASTARMPERRFAAAVGSLGDPP